MDLGLLEAAFVCSSLSGPRGLIGRSLYKFERVLYEFRRDELIICI